MLALAAPQTFRADQLVQPEPGGRLPASFSLYPTLPLAAARPAGIHHRQTSAFQAIGIQQIWQRSAVTPELPTIISFWLLTFAVSHQHIERNPNILRFNVANMYAQWQYQI